MGKWLVFKCSKTSLGAGGGGTYFLSNWSEFIGSTKTEVLSVGTVPTSQGALWIFAAAHAQAGQDRTPFSPRNEMHPLKPPPTEAQMCATWRCVGKDGREVWGNKARFFVLKEVLDFLPVSSRYDGQDATLWAERSTHKQGHESSAGGFPFVSEDA